MKLLKGVGDFFALDVGTTAVRVVQLSGDADKWSLLHVGYAPIDIKTASANSAESTQKLGEVIMTAVGQSGVRTKNIAIGIPSQKAFTTVIELPLMPENELKGTIKYQIDRYIPMTIDEAKVDWVSLGKSMRDPSQQEILLTSTANSYAEERLDFIEGLGFNVIAIEPDPIAMVRSLLPPGLADARLMLDVGEFSTDLVMTYNDAPRLVRTIPTGVHTLVKAAAQNLNVQEDQARQFILKFGLAQDRLEGQVYKAVEGVLENFVSEIEKSIKFFQTRYPETSVGGMLLSGYASTIPQLGDYIGGKSSLAIQPANPWAKVSMSSGSQQQLANISSEFAVAVGLAQRSKD